MRHSQARTRKASAVFPLPSLACSSRRREDDRQVRPTPENSALLLGEWRRPYARVFAWHELQVRLRPPHTRVAPASVESGDHAKRLGVGFPQSQVWKLETNAWKAGIGGNQKSTH